MKAVIFNILIYAVLVITFSSCENTKELPPFHAKGTIIGVTALCYGEVVIIEVENPLGIGFAGMLPSSTEDKITYKNAIGVPYFSKIGIPDSIPQTIGTWLSFEYRELTQEERETSNLFSSTEPIMCLANIIPPNAKYLIITKIFEFK
jgi:hypothetical protein